MDKREKFVFKHFITGETITIHAYSYFEAYDKLMRRTRYTSQWDRVREED